MIEQCVGTWPCLLWAKIPIKPGTIVDPVETPRRCLCHRRQCILSGSDKVHPTPKRVEEPYRGPVSTTCMRILVSTLALIALTPTAAGAQTLADLLATMRAGGGWVSIPIEGGRGELVTRVVLTGGMTIAGCVQIWPGHSGRWEIDATETRREETFRMLAHAGQPAPFSHKTGPMAQIDLKVRWSEPRDTTLFLWVGLEWIGAHDRNVCEPVYGDGRHRDRRDDILPLARGNRVDLDDLPEEIRQAFPKTGGQRWDRAAAQRVEKEYILAVLELNGGNQTRTAEQLGIGSTPQGGSSSLKYLGWLQNARYRQLRHKSLSHSVLHVLSQRCSRL